MIILLPGQDKPKSHKADTVHVDKVVIDTITKSERLPKTEAVLLEQKEMINKLDKLIEKQKRK